MGSQLLVLNVFKRLFSAPLDMVFIVDGLGLVGSQTFKVLKDFVKRIIHAFIVSAQSTRVGFAQITDSGHVDFNLDQYNELQALDRAIDAVPLKAGSKRYAGVSVVKAYTSIFQTTGRRGLVPRVLVVITTGRFEDDVASVGNDLRNQKVNTLVVNVGENTDKLQGVQLATSPAQSFAEEDIANLQSVVKGVVERINKGICIFVDVPSVIISVLLYYFQLFYYCYQDLGMTAGRVESTDGLTTGGVSSTAELEKGERLGETEGIPNTPPLKGSSASDGPGVIHCKWKKIAEIRILVTFARTLDQKS